MSRRNQTFALAVLIVILGVTAYNYLYRAYWPSADTVKATMGTEKFVPVNVDNPALRLDVLQHFLNLQYKGSHRNIFSSTVPPLPKPVHTVPVILPAAVPSGPAPLTVDAKYFGYMSDPGGSHRRGLFSSSNNEEVFILGEGDTFMGRFRVVKITNTATEVEEVSSGRRATLNLEQPGPNG